MQQVEQFGFQSSVNFATSARLRRIGKSVEAPLLPLVEPAADGFRVYVAQNGELFERETFVGKQNRLRPLTQPVDGTMTMNVFKRGALGLRKSRNELHAEILPESKIPGYLCMTT